MPKVYIIPQESPNAFATGRDPAHAAVAATEGILRLLSPDELEGVLAHEMAHVRNRDILIGTVAATLAGAIMMLANMARFAAIFGGGRDDREGGGGGLQLLVMAILAPLGAMLVQMAVSRSREYLADETGARFCGKPEALARALEKISGWSRQVPMQASPATAHMFIMSPLTGGGLMSLFSTHPPVEKRVERLMAMRGRPPYDGDLVLPGKALRVRAPDAERLDRGVAAPASLLSRSRAPVHRLRRPGEDDVPGV